MAKTNHHPAALYQLRKVTRILALIILVLVAGGFFMPTDYRVERSVVINAPREVIFQNIFQGDYLPRWMYVQNGQIDAFEGNLEEGDSITLSYNDIPDRGVLSVIVQSEQGVSFDVRPKSKVNVVHNDIRFQSDNNETLVVWTIEGDLSAGLLSPYLAFFANNIAGNNFEKSLHNLKEIIEARH
ncbi:SRPBCC family protein [Marinomonas profundimaris]|uniref:Polyketide cyclase n=1 Tax=Marinomonas profundimaris TaxID=1208321 RepID=W1S3C9_9GAMM|nr:polyketide cyclase [Marinomonas profundimaris]ETI61628.1 polyketide cyclase [Marinomonas profundimaris]